MSSWNERLYVQMKLFRMCNFFMKLILHQEHLHENYTLYFILLLDILIKLHT